MVLPVETGRWVLLALAVAIVATLGALVAYCQRGVDEVAEVFFEMGRRDMLREMNNARGGQVVRLHSARIDA